MKDDAGWSSPVARRAHNPKVAGSNPVPAPIEEEASPEGLAFLILAPTLMDAKLKGDSAEQTAISGC